MLPKFGMFNFNFPKVPKDSIPGPTDSVPIGGPSILPPAPKPLDDPPPDSVPIGGGTSGGVPPRPRQSDPNQPDYETQEEYDAWAGGGVPHYGVNQPQVETEEEREIRLAGLAGSSNASTGGGGYGKKRVAEDSRGQANLTGSRRSSLLTGRR